MCAQTPSFENDASVLQVIDRVSWKLHYFGHSDGKNGRLVIPRM